jgi:hypothetical protein
MPDRYIYANAADRSPNGFSKDQCTWYVDSKTENSGWKLGFSGSKGDAYKWYGKGYIKNAALGNTGKPGDIMVFGNSKDSNGKDYSKGYHGHVGYITNNGYWNGKRAWTVRHSNWGTGFGQWVVSEETKKYGATVTQCTFVEYKPNWVKIQNGNSLGSTGYPLLGFIYKK